MMLTLKRVAQASPQLGEYDPAILCEKCDNALGRFDDYALEICSQFEKHCIANGSTFELTGVDADKFAKFVLAVLWRASISRRQSFSQIQLGKYEDQFRNLIFGTEKVESLRALDILVQRYTSRVVDMKGVYFHPIRQQFGNLNSYILTFGGFRVIAKLDNRALPENFRFFSITKQRIFCGVFLEFEQTREFDSLKKIVHADSRRNGYKPNDK